ncbi:MAG: hypothetical protein B6I37_02470 [Desulfobacteraceae bacterium 4572_35.2]|nr:MAG: hypothetical protein B6I37_02470 [Desulfobacteraceae bacterium 4572_35.2]
MKKKVLLIAIILAQFTFIGISGALAADQYSYTGKGTVTFNHAEHRNIMECSACHTGEEPDKIVISNKKEGHGLCLSCHKTEKKKGNKAAPTSCSQCHKK